MVDLKRISQGRIERPPRICVHGFSAVGKTTFACGAPDPLVIDADRGSHKVDVRRVMPESWPDAMEWISAVERGEVQCKTLILDSLTELEAMSHAHFFAGESINSWGKGYGRGDEYAIMRWREVLAQLERISSKGIGITFVAHAVVKNFKDPSVADGGYDRFEIAARPKLAQLITQWCDYVLFAALDVTPLGKDTNVATTTGIRYIYTRRRPSWDAKARGTMLFPEKLLLSYAEFDKAVKADAARTTELRSVIESMLTEIGDGKFGEAVLDYCKKYPEGITEAHNRVAARLDEVRRSKPAQQAV